MSTIASLTALLLEITLYILLTAFIFLEAIVIVWVGYFIIKKLFKISNK